MARLVRRSLKDVDGSALIFNNLNSVIIYLGAANIHGEIRVANFFSY